MTSLNPGINPAFDIAAFDIEDQRVLRRMSQLFYLTREGALKIGASTSSYRYALIKPTNSMKGLLHTDREVMVVFSSYSAFQPRTLDAFDHIIQKFPEDFRIEKVVRILISNDNNISEKLKALFKSKPDAPIVIPFHVSEFSLSTPDNLIAARIREFTFSRDLFSMSSPLRSDLYFYGRKNLINEITSKLSSGENFGLFGLRRSGKTSLVSGISRSLKARSGSSITIDCQSPSVHQLRWNELLNHIVIKLKNNYSLSINVGRKENYDYVMAPDSFLDDLKKIKSILKSDFIAILFDEIERISFGTASSQHWNSDRDFLLFWQSIRSGFQSEGAPYTFLVVGTNPSAFEKPKIFESDNPLFGNVEKRFIPLFSEDQVEEMIDDLGSIMGIKFDKLCKSNLFKDFGGHPFLTRYACSFIAQEAKDRPVIIDRTIYDDGIEKFSVESDSYVDSVVGYLQEEYEDEYEMMKYLGSGNEKDFDALAMHDPRLLEHLNGYGLVIAGVKAHYFRIGIVEKYFSKKDRPVELMNKESKIAEISRRRNIIESMLRKHILQIGTLSFSKRDRREKILSKLTSQRRQEFSHLELEVIYLSDESPLLFSELKNTICGLWDFFQNSIEMQKNEFEYHMNTINKFRIDAHSKGISSEDFNKTRVSLTSIENCLPPQF